MPAKPKALPKKATKKVARPNKKEAKPCKKGKPGRTTDYDEKKADTIIDGLIDGKSLVQICEPSNMPHRRTVIRWMDRNPEFATRIARAREEQAEYMDHLVLKTAEECTSENSQAARVKIAAYQWRAAKLKPKSFGDHSSVKVDQTTRKVPITDEKIAEKLKQSPAYRRSMQRILDKAATHDAP